MKRVNGSVGTQGQVVMPPDHGESLKGSLASHTTVTVSGDEWHETKERAWREAARERERFPA